MTEEMAEPRHLGPDSIDLSTESIDLMPTDEEGRNERAMAAVRLVVAVVTVVNIVAQPFGWAPLGIDSEQLYMVLSGIASIAATLWAWWRNNNCTEQAQMGQKATDAAKELGALGAMLTIVKRSD